MATSQWHRVYTANVEAPAEVLFGLLSDLPNYVRWLPASEQYSETTDVEPYPVRLGTRYHDGKPGETGKGWWGAVTGYQPPGSIDFHHTIDVRQLRTAIDVHIHYSFEANETGTRVNRWLMLDITMPWLLKPLRRAVISRFDKENVRTLAEVKQYAEANSGRGSGSAQA
jgi:hypothetical protein